MSTRLEQLAVDIKPPKRGQLLALAADATTRFVDLTADATIDGKITKPWCGRYMTLQAVGADIYVCLSKTAATNIVPATASVVAANVATPNDSAAHLIPSGTSLTFFMESETTDYKFLAYLAASGSGMLRVWPSSPPELRR